ncbi:hypothetical protein AF72_07120 [Xylella taiwanensis]|uniref:Uncharacterized protein n=1 Tax=Xylella taiwanensis TaxID=1444770 RepID=Z9JIA5_9GAMM|nr:hypothetical protein AF72_07120 [Xylella taiwanensis]
MSLRGAARCVVLATLPRLKMPTLSISGSERGFAVTKYRVVCLVAGVTVSCGAGATVI